MQILLLVVVFISVAGLVLGVAGDGPGPVPVLLGTAFHLALWLAVARYRTRPDGAVL